MVNYGHILKLELAEFAEGADVEFKRKKEIKDDSKVFSLNSWNQQYIG